MADDASDTEVSTRRDYLKYSALLGTTGFVAGCRSGGDSTPTDGGDDPDAETSTPTPSPSPTATATTENDETATAVEASPTATDAASPAPTDTASPAPTRTDDGPYTVEMAPMGAVEFAEPPESIYARTTTEAGMAFALGRADDVDGIYAADYYDALWNQFTPRLPGVELDWTGLYDKWNPSKEQLYELDSDIHLADPAAIDALKGWSRDDTEEIRTQVAPWFGNYYSWANAEVPGDWSERYEYYGLWEMFERTARAFRERERYEALKTVRDDLVATIQSDLPPEDERTTATMALLRDLDDIWMYKVNVDGYLAAHTRPCRPIEAFGENTDSGANVDMEALLEADPDVLFALGGMHPETDMAGIRQSLEDHPVGSTLSAVQDDRVHAQGARFQGPILNLFQLEMTAKQLYPDQFGEWPRYVEGPYPELPAEERMFDRGRVADVINGDL